MINFFNDVAFGSETIEVFLSYIIVICFCGMMFDWIKGVGKVGKS